MCGIVGLLASTPDRDLVSRLLTRMHHRGPDEVSLCAQGSAIIGMARLRIRDIDTAGVLPTCKRSGAPVGFNGQVFSLSRADPKVSVTTLADEASAVFGATHETDLDAMYAAVTTTPKGEELIVARDRFGIKPLFVSISQNRVICASEISALASEGVVGDASKTAVIEGLAFGRALGNRTIFRNTFSLPPGTRQRITLSGDTHLDAFATPRDGSEPECGDLVEQMRRSVAKCLASEKRVGLALSGGIDSTILAFFCNELGFDELTTFTLVVEGSSDHASTLEELGLPQRGAWKHWRHVVVKVNYDKYLSAFAESVNALGFPTRMTSVPLYFLLGQAAKREGVTVLLCGEGADELFGGYETYRRWLRENQACDQPATLVNFALPRARELTIDKLCGGRQVRGLKDSFQAAYTALCGSTNVSALLDLELSMSLEPLLLRTDLCLARSSIEGRVPFLHGLVPEFRSVIDQQELQTSNLTKPLLRRSFASVLPPHALQKRKIPFRAPLSDIMRNTEASVRASWKRAFISAGRDLAMNTAALMQLWSTALAGDYESSGSVFYLLSYAALETMLVGEGLPVT